MRSFRAADGAIMYALNEDPEVLQHTGDVQFADVAAASAFLRNYDQYEKYSVCGLSIKRLSELQRRNKCDSILSAVTGHYCTMFFDGLNIIVKFGVERDGT